MSDGVTGNIRYVRERAQDATDEKKGLIRLAGDLGGTADNPRVVSIPVEVSVSLVSGGTGADLSGTGPGVLVQDSSGASVSVETLSPARGGTGVNNGNHTLIVPAAGTAAMRNTANTFAGDQTIQGKMRVETSPGGFFVWSHASVDAAAQTILPAGKMTNAVWFWATIERSSGGEWYYGDFLLVGAMPGEAIALTASTITPWGDGNSFTFRIQTDGTFDIRRTAGSLTYKVLMRGMYL